MPANSSTPNAAWYTPDEEGKFCVVEGREDVRNDSLFVNVHAQDLTFFVNANYAICRLVLRSHKYSFPGDTVHVYASARFQVVKVDETIFCHEVYDVVLLGNLHRYWEVVGSFRREVDINRLLCKRRIGGIVVDFHDM
jgi:hypothetical protein